MIKFLFSNWRDVNEKHLNGRWHGGLPGELFRCAWCGKKFKIGDKYNLVYTNNDKCSTHIMGNPLICKECVEEYNQEYGDNYEEELIEELEHRAYELHIKYESRYWWFLRRVDK